MKHRLVVGLAIGVGVLIGLFFLGRPILRSLGFFDASTVRTYVDVSKTTYSRDSRTNLCFATLGRGEAWTIMNRADSFSHTYVPCSPEVVALIGR